MPKKSQINEYSDIGKFPVVSRTQPVHPQLTAPFFPGIIARVLFLLLLLLTFVVPTSPPGKRWAPVPGPGRSDWADRYRIIYWQAGLEIWLCFCRVIIVPLERKEEEGLGVAFEGVVHLIPWTRSMGKKST